MMLQANQKTNSFIHYMQSEFFTEEGIHQHVFDPRLQ